MEKDISKKVRTQIEYYLSDGNLQHDIFFYDKLIKDSKVDLDVIMSCNNIKKLSVTKEDIVESLKESEVIYVEGDSIKRRNETLPNFLGKKRDNHESKIKKKLENSDSKEKMNFAIENTEAIIIYLTSDKDQSVKWKDVKKYIDIHYPDFECVYFRFSHQKGHAALFPLINEKDFVFSTNNDLNLKESDDKEFDSEIIKERLIQRRENLLPKVTSKIFQMNDINFTCQLADENQLAEFWKDHGSHYEFCISGRSDSQAKKKQPKENKNLLKTPVNIGGEMYNF